MPKDFSPSSASPESLRRMRWYTGVLLPAMVWSPRRPWREVMLLRLGARAGLLAHLEAGEAAHDDVLLDESDLLLDDLAHRLLLVADVRLLEQADLGEVLLELALRDLVLDVLGLARGRRLVDLALLLEHLGRHVLPADVERIGGRDVHGDLLDQRLEVRGLGHEVRLAVHL